MRERRGKYIGARERRGNKKSKGGREGGEKRRKIREVGKGGKKKEARVRERKKIYIRRYLARAKSY